MSFAANKVTHNMRSSPYAPSHGVTARKRRRGAVVSVGGMKTRAGGPMDWDARGQSIERDSGTHNLKKVF